MPGSLVDRRNVKEKNLASIFMVSILNISLPFYINREHIKYYAYAKASEQPM
jgi:hypothetical protein